MPAIRNLAIYAAGGVFIDAILQCTVFISAMALDLKRMESNRVDCLPCLKLTSAESQPKSTAGGNADGVIGSFIRRRYAPWLLRKEVKMGVIMVFVGLFFGGIIGAQWIEMGLDQRLALPGDSYLVDYFDDLDA